MKISKKLLAAFSVAAMLVTALSVTGCKKEDDDDNAINGNNIALTNDSALLYRAFESLKSKHVSSTAAITINNPTTLKTAANKANSVIGYVFGLEEIDTPEGSPTEGYQYKKDGSLEKKKIKYFNFGVAGVRYNNDNKKLEWYVSYCTKVPNTIFGYNGQSAFAGDNAKIITAVGADGKPSTTVTSPAAENEIVNGGNVFESLAYNLVDGKVQVRIQVKVNSDGAYTVTLQNQQGIKIDGSTVATVPVTGLTTKTQKEIGRYVTVYAGETANAVLTFSDTTGNPIPVSEDDWVDLSK